MPQVNSTIEKVGSNGIRSNVTVRDIGVEVGTTKRALSYNATTSSLLLVDLFTPRKAFNMGNDFVLICCVCTTDDTLAWLPGRINLPCILNGFSTYDNNTGLASWLSTLATGAQNAQPLTVEDATKGKKVIEIGYANNKLIFDSTALISTLNSYSSRLRSPKQIGGARSKFDLTIMSRWGNQALSARNIVRNGNGQIDIRFESALPNADYGVSLSLQSNKPGIIQYSNVTEKGLSIVTYDLQGKLAQFDGDFSFDIQT